MLTNDDYLIENGKLYFEFTELTLIMTSITPTVGDLAGGYPFTLYGNYTNLEDTFELWWENVMITYELNENKTQLSGTVPPTTIEYLSIYPKIISDGVPHWNYEIVFTYKSNAVALSCWPPTGPRTGQTQLEIKGDHFDEWTRPLVGGEIKLTPI